MEPSTSEVEINLENQNQRHSLLGNELPESWPQILSWEEETQVYRALQDEGDNLAERPKNAHMNKFSYELTQGQKKVRFFATFHQRDMSGPNDPNMQQYEIIERQFQQSPPQLVLYEGFVDDVNYPLTRKQAMSLGEPAWMCYLVQQYNKNLREGEKPIVIESGDKYINSPNEIRDPEIIKNAANKLKTYDKVDIVFGSGHAIRERGAWEQYFDQTARSLGKN